MLSSVWDKLFRKEKKMVCDKCDQQAMFYCVVMLPHQAPNYSRKRYWCRSCVDGVPSGVFNKFERGRAPTLEEHLQDSIATLQQKINRLEETSDDQYKSIANYMKENKRLRSLVKDLEFVNKKKTEHLNTKTREIRNLKERIHRLEQSAYWGPGHYNAFAQQQAQYNAMMQAQVKAMQTNIRPMWVSPSMSGLGCYAKGTKLMAEKKHDEIVDSLNEQLKAQQENFEKQEENLAILREKIGLWRKCNIVDRCPACDHEMEKVLKDTE